jgi:Gram-negative bacterial TonB protein C-terminal
LSTLGQQVSKPAKGAYIVTLFTAAILATALQTGAPLAVQPPPDKVRCILAIAAVGDSADAPFTAFNYYDSGYLRIERELRLGGASRNVKDLLVHLDNGWYAMGAASIDSAPSIDPAMGGAMMPVLRVPMVGAFALALANGRSLTLWDNSGRQEQYNLGNFDAETIADWRKCIATAPPPTVSPDIGYRLQPPYQQLRPLNTNIWITGNDYPSKLIREEISGLVAYRLEIGVNGRVTNCSLNAAYVPVGGEVVNNVPELNETTCRLVTRRARFQPATDGAGRPFSQYYTGRIRWELPVD